MTGIHMNHSNLNNKMGKVKEYYHEEINEGLHVNVVSEPYMFRYTLYLQYGGDTYTIYGDTYEKLTELARRIVKDIQCLIDDPREMGAAFDCGEWTLPVRLFENKNPIFA